MTDYVVLKRYIVLKKFTIRVLFCFSLLWSMSHASDPRGSDPIRVIHADDEPVPHRLMGQAVTKHNDGKPARQIELVKRYWDGSNVKLQELLGVHLLVLDIRMPNDGCSTLVRLQSQALRRGIKLPPCIAATSERDYLNLDGTTPTLATDRGFLFAREKIGPGPLGFPSVFPRCAELLGEDWLTTQCGREGPRVFYDCDGVVDVRELLGVNLLVLDIDKTGRGNGYTVWTRLHLQATEAGINLPPCMAITTQDGFLNPDGTTLTHLTERGFLFAYRIRPDVSPITSIYKNTPSIYQQCEGLLGRDWLTMNCGRRATTPIWEVNQTTFSVSDTLRRSDKSRLSMRERWNSWRGQAKRAPRLSASALTYLRKEGHPFEAPSSAPDDATVPSSMRSPAPMVPHRTRALYLVAP